MTELEFIKLEEDVQRMRTVADEHCPRSLRLVTLRNLLTSLHSDLVDRRNGLGCPDCPHLVTPPEETDK